MGKRSITSTKSGKFMNPTDQARKEQRRKELKKNKKQRMAVRHAVLKGKDSQKLITDLDELDDMELNPTKLPSLSEKVLKDKRKKLLETFDRVMKLYEREEPEAYAEFKELFDQYNDRRSRKQQYYDEVKSAERVLVDEIPLPDLPDTAGPEMSTYDIPLPQPKSILKKSGTSSHADEKRRKPPGPPPGQPPALSDSEDEQEKDAAVENRSRSIRFQDEEGGTSPSRLNQEEEGESTSTVPTKPITPLQAAMLKMAADKAAKSLEESAEVAAGDNTEEVFAEHGNISDVLEDKTASNTDLDGPVAGLPPAAVAAAMVGALPEPIIYRGPGGAPVIGLHPASLRPPAGLLPPGPPPGLPPALRLHRLPTGLPPRLIRPPMSIPPPGMRPGMQQSNVLSAPPSIMKPPTSQSNKDTHATISAKPIIKHHIGDVTRFMPTSLKIKRDAQKKPTTISKAGLSSVSMPASNTAQPRKAGAASGQTKDDAYEMFMREMEGIM